MTGGSAPPRVVLGPDILLGALYDEPSREVLERWRDERLLLVLHRDLILAYLRLLRSAGIGPDLLKSWATRLHHSEHSLLVSGEFVGGSMLAACQNLAHAQKADLVTTAAAEPGLTPSEWLAKNKDQSKPV